MESRVDAAVREHIEVITELGERGKDVYTVVYKIGVVVKVDPTLDDRGYIAEQLYAEVAELLKDFEPELHSVELVEKQYDASNDWTTP